MKKIPPRTINVLQPKDSSVEAYKTWMKGIARQLASDAEIEWTEERWIQKWQQYWQKRSQRNNKSGPDNANAE